MSFLDRIIGDSKRVGLALGAGGARGVAHIGVMMALQELGYSIDWVAGSSMGAIVAAMFAGYAFGIAWALLRVVLRHPPWRRLRDG